LPNGLMLKAPAISRLLIYHATLLRDAFSVWAKPVAAGISNIKSANIFIKIPGDILA